MQSIVLKCWRGAAEYNGITSIVSDFIFSLKCEVFLGLLSRVLFTDGNATGSVELGGQMPPFLGPGQQRMRTAFPGPGTDHMLSLSPRSSETGALGVNMAEYVLDGGSSLSNDQDSRLLVMSGRFVSCLLFVTCLSFIICQVAPVCTPPNTCFLGPTWVQIPNGILIGSAVFCTAHCRVAILYNGPPFSPSKLLLPMGDLDPI